MRADPVELAASVVATGVVSFGLTALWRRYALRRGLLDQPSSRSSHTQATPSGGGVGIVVAVSIAAVWLAIRSVWAGAACDAGAVAASVSLALPLAWVGLRDDRQGVSPWLRLAVQVVVVGALLGALAIIRPPVETPTLSAWCLFWLALLSGVWWINLFNFMDGIDGLAAVQVVTMLICAALLAAWQVPHISDSVIWWVVLCVVAAALGFLALNRPPARIFMGDVGSTWLAFVVFALALVTVRWGWLSAASWSILAAVFVSDATVTLLRRLLRGEKVWQAHRSHAYQRLARQVSANRTTAHRSVGLLALGINLLWLAPLAAASLWQPQWSAVWLGLAYGPLLLGVSLLGAGPSDAG